MAGIVVDVVFEYFLTGMCFPLSFSNFQFLVLLFPIPVGLR
jgi:hypothetical protein